MTENKLETEVKACSLIEYCGDFHKSGIAFCEGRKNPKECPSYGLIENQDNSGIYGGGPLGR